MELDPQTTAVIAIHCQGDIIGEHGAFADYFHAEVDNCGVVNSIGGLLARAREAGAAVVYTRIAFKPDFSDLEANSPLLQIVEQAGCLKEGSAQAEIISELAPGPNDLVFTNQRVGGFTEELARALEGRGIDTLLFAGVATNISVEGTARVASDGGYGWSSFRTPAPRRRLQPTRQASERSPSSPRSPTRRTSHGSLAGRWRTADRRGVRGHGNARGHGRRTEPATAGSRQY